MAREYEQLIYEQPAPRVARIVMNRPDKRNAQGIIMTVELEAALKHANHDPEVRVIILAGAGVSDMRFTGQPWIEACPDLVTINNPSAVVSIGGALARRARCS